MASRKEINATSLSPASRWIYKTLLAIRPAELASLAKVFLGIRRRATKISDGLCLWVDPASHFGYELVRTGTYEPALSELFQVILRPGDDFVDVGGNEGYFSLLAANLVKTGNVYCIEPQSRLQPVLERNIELNQNRNIKLCHEALSDSAGQLTLNLSSTMNTGCSGFYRKPRWGMKKEQVPSTTLDLFFLKTKLAKARLIKIDCEGNEGLVVSGAAQIIENHQVDYWVVDFHESITGRQAPVAVDTIFRKSGYQLTRAGNGIWIYHLPGLEQALSALGTFEPVGPLTSTAIEGMNDLSPNLAFREQWNGKPV